MKIKQIVITPNYEDATKSDVKLDIIDEDGTEKTIEAAGGLTIVAATDSDYYMGTQKNPIPVFNFLAHELLQEDSFLANLFFSAIIAASYTADPPTLLRLYDELFALTNMYMEQYDFVTGVEKSEDTKEGEEATPPPQE